MDESCPIWMRHVAYEWVMSHMNASCQCHTLQDARWLLLDGWPCMDESCHICMSHVTHSWVISHMNASCHIWMSHVKYEWVMSHTHESCHVRMSHVTYPSVLSPLQVPFTHVSLYLRTMGWQCTNDSCHIWISHIWNFHWWQLITNISSHMGWLRLVGSLKL